MFIERPGKYNEMRYFLLVLNKLALKNHLFRNGVVMSRYLLLVAAFGIFGVVAIPDTGEVFAQSGQTSVSDAESQEKIAVERFWSILEKNPRRGTSLDRVYGYYVDTGQMDSLIERCQKLTEKSPEDAKTWLLLGLVFSRRSDDTGTINAFEKAEQLDLNDAMSSFYLGESLIAQGRLKEASLALERAVARKPSRNDVLAVLQTLGRVYERFGEQKKSDEIWAKMEEMFPNDLDILVRIAETLEEEGKFEESLKRYQKLAELAKKDNYARVRFTLSAADIKIRLGNKQEAITDFENLLEELAGDSWLADSVRDRVERVFVRQADYAGLAGYYQKRITAHPNDLDTARRLAVALVRLSRTEEAKTLLRNTLEKAPSNIPLRLAYIDLLVNDKDFEDVDKEYAEIDKLDPNNPDVISQWGLAVLENRKLDEQTRKANAAKIWLKLVETRPNDVAMIVMVADLMAGGNVHDEAEKLYQKAIELAPNDPSYREYLGYFYHRRGQKDLAVQTFRQIAEGERRNAANLAQLGNILQSLGYTNDALTAMKEAAELAPNDFALKLRYSDLLTENGNYDAAKTELAAVQKLVETDDELDIVTQQETKLLTATGELAAAADSLLEKTAEKLETVEKTIAKDWWKLAVYRRAEGNLEPATDAIEKALEFEPTSLLILQTAADIYAKGFNQSKAADIYEKLAGVDTARRIDHLKKLANLQQETGQTDKAIETARLVMATGAGNAANSRFYADMLLGIGRRSDGIEALRRAVRVDPTDQVSLGALADQLAGSGQFDESIEIIWRIYDRTEDLHGKMGVIGKLSNYYQMSQRFDQLIERLRQNMKDAAGRREAAYCLAQAHATVGDFYAARNALEMLLTNVDEEKTSDTFLLNQLSRVAEMQGDFSSAIRYQEMLCDLSNLPQDHDRLLGLYFASGEKEKASNLYIQTILSKTADFADQVDAIDKMLAREEYTTVKQVLDRLETKYPDNWELKYRKLETLHWLKEGDTASWTSLATEICRMSIPGDEFSAGKQKELSNPKKTATNIQGRSNNPYGGGYSPWGFGQHHGYSPSFHQSGNSNSILATWSMLNSELIPTLFREHLKLEEYYYQRGSAGSGRQPEKPLFKPETFGDAKFAALTWEMKFLADEDMKDFKANQTNEGTEEAAQEKAEETEENENREGETEVAREENTPKMERLYKRIHEIFDSLPEDSENKSVLLDRIRLTTFLTQWNDSQANVKPPKTWEEGLAQKSMEQAKAKLGLLGENEWKQAAFDSIFQSLLGAIMLKKFESTDIDAEVAKTFPANVTEMKKENIRAIATKLIADFKKEQEQKEKEGDILSTDQKIDWILACVKQAAGENPQRFQQMLRQYSGLIDILKAGNRDDEITALNDLIEKTGQESPEVFVIMAWNASIRYGDSPILSLLWELPGPPFAQSDSDRFDNFDTVKEWLIKAKDVTIRNFSLKKQKSPSPNFGINIAAVIRDYASGKSQRMLFQIFGENRVREAEQEASIPSLGGMMGAGYRIYSPLPSQIVPSPEETVDEDSDKKQEKKVLSKEEVRLLAKVSEELYKTLDFYFEQQGEINMAELAAEKKPVSNIRRQMQSLSQYRYYFDGRNRMGSYEIQMLLNPGQGPVRHDEILMGLPQGFATLDYLVKHSEPGEGVTKEELVTDNGERFMKYIAEKAADTNPGVAQIAKNFQTQWAYAQNQPTGENPEENEQILGKLVSEYEAANEKNETFAPTKLFLMGILYSQSEKYEKAIETLDAIPFTSAGDAKLRETIVLQLYQRSDQTGNLKQRAQTAIDRLLGYQLSPEELKTLRTALRQFDRNEEADAIRDRLMVSANDLNTMQEMLDELRNAGESKKEQTAQFALKVFRSPALSGVQAMRNDSYARYVKSQALDVLKNAGKLEEIIEQIEAQWKSSPGSFDIMVSLADIYHRADRKDDAKKMAEEMGKQIPDDAQKMLSYATVLRELDMKNEAAEWTGKALEKEPTLFLNNYWEYQRIFTETNQSEKLLDLLKKIAKNMPQQNRYQFGDCLRNLMREEKTKDAAKELFQSLWDHKDGTDVERREMRRVLVDSMIFDTNKEYYPYFHEVLFTAIEVVPKGKKTQQPSIDGSVANMLSIRDLSSDKAYSLVGNFIETAEQNDKLTELGTELEAITAAHLEVAQEQRDWERYGAARILEAIVNAKLNQVDKSLEIFQEIKENKKTETLLNTSALMLAQILETSEDSRMIALAVELCEKAIKDQGRYGGGGFADSYLERKLILLYLKSGHPEKGRERGLAAIRKSLRILKQCGTTNGQIQIGNQYYGIWDLSESIQQYGNALKNGGCALEMMLIYRQQCEGQPWFKALMEHQNFRYYAQRVKEPFESLLESITVEEIAKHIDMFIPIGAKNTDDSAESNTETSTESAEANVETNTESNEGNITPGLPLEMGISINVKPTSSDSAKIPLIASKLFGAIEMIADNDPDLFTKIRDSLKQLATDHPDEPTVLIVDTFCQTLTGNPAGFAESLRKCAAWIDQNETEKVADQVYVGFWILVRDVYTNPEKYNPDALAGDCEKLALFAGRLIGKKIESGDKNTQSEGNALKDDIFRFMPDSVAKDAKIVISFESLKNALFPSGTVVDNLKHEYDDYANQYVVAAECGNIDLVLKVYENMFKNGWPILNASRDSQPRETAMLLLMILNKSLDAAEKTGADPNVVVDSLFKIVMPLEKEKNIFLGIYEDLGGQDGVFRSLGVLLIDWCMKAGRIEDFRKREDEFLKIHAENSTGTDDNNVGTDDDAKFKWLVPLESLKLTLALKTNDEADIKSWTSHFLNKLNETRDARYGRLVLAAIEDQGLDPKTLELLDVSLSLSQKGPKYCRFAYHVIRKNWFDLVDSGQLDMAVRWAGFYRNITKEGFDGTRPDGFRNTMDSRLMLEGEKALDEDRLPLAVSILRYLADESTGNPRYRDLTEYLATLENKVSALDETNRKELLGDLDLTTIVRKGTVAKDEKKAQPRTAATGGLPELPTGTVVYENDFSQGADEHWSPQRWEITPVGKRPYLGEFYNIPVTFRRNNLPEHKFLRIRFDLLMIGGIDGLVGATRHFGVDTWTMTINDRIKPIATTFSNYDHDPNNQKQSYPDDYPPLLGQALSWQNRVDKDDVWGDDLETGMYFGRHGAVESNQFSGREKDALYAVDIIVPHDKSELLIEFTTQFQDGPFGLDQYNLAFGECWGLTNFRVEAIAEPLTLTEEELKLCFDALIGGDGIKANAARHRLVAAGNPSVDYIERWMNSPENVAKVKEFATIGNFLGFRVKRVLQLIDTSESVELLQKNFPSQE